MLKVVIMGSDCSDWEPVLIVVSRAQSLGFLHADTLLSNHCQWGSVPRLPSDWESVLIIVNRAQSLHS